MLNSEEPIFDEIERGRTDALKEGEPYFSYLNTSARRQAAEIRKFLEKMSRRYPSLHRPALRTRIRSLVNVIHQSATFELLLHELCLCCDLNVEAIEPTLSHTTKKPDFLVQLATGEKFFLEAVVATGESDAEAGASARRSQVFEALDSVSSKYLLIATVRGEPAHSLRTRALKRELKDWLHELPDREDDARAFTFSHKEHGAEVEVRVLCERRGRLSAARSIAARSAGARWIRPGGGIRESVERKAGRYGKLDLPYVVAVDALSQLATDDDAVNAMLGSPSLIIREYSDGRRETIDSREADGVWFKKRPSNTGLSAIICFEGLSRWNLTGRFGTIIRNPWARLPLPLVPFGLRELNPHAPDNELIRTDGLKLGEIFGLPLHWPNGPE